MKKKLLTTLTLTTLILSTIYQNALGENLRTKASVNVVKNQVQLKYNRNDWIQVEANQEVKPGSIIRTAGMSSAEILYSDNTITQIGSYSYVTVLDSATRELDIAQGSVWFKVEKNSYGLKIYVPNAEIRILGTEGGVNVERLKVQEKKNKDISINSGQKTITFSNKKESDIPPAKVSILVREGIVEANINKKKYMLYPGHRIDYSTLEPDKIAHVKTDIRKMLTSSKSDKNSNKQNVVISNQEKNKNNLKPVAKSESGNQGNTVPRIKLSSLKANMKTVQSMLEMYSIDSGGYYPQDVNDLINDAKNKGYYKSFKNPFTNAEGVGLNKALLNYSDVSKSKKGGSVLYEALQCTENKCLVYRLYSNDIGGNLLKDRGQVFYLSNR